MSQEVYTANLLRNMRRDKKIIMARFVSTGVLLMRRVWFKVLQPTHSRIDQCRQSGKRNGAAQKRAASGRKSHIRGFHFMNSLMWGKVQMVPPMHRSKKIYIIEDFFQLLSKMTSLRLRALMASGPKDGVVSSCNLQRCQEMAPQRIPTYPTSFIRLSNLGARRSILGRKVEGRWRTGRKWGQLWDWR